MLIARTVLAIVIAGVVTSWLSGAILDGRERVEFLRAATHAALAFVAIVASVYLAVDQRDRLHHRDWHQGHERG